jgi:signal transduction histidine kinase
VQERVDLGDAVSEAAGVLKKGGAEIDLRLAPELAGLTVIANRVQLLQIIGNIVLNACEAGERKGGDSVLIEVFAEQDADVVRLFVRDNGAGLDREQLTRVFQRGFTTKEGAGSASGIGLHWCANTVAAIGGSMRIDSEGPGLGATVQIELPAAPPTHESSAAGARKRPAAPRTAVG